MGTKKATCTHTPEYPYPQPTVGYPDPCQSLSAIANPNYPPASVYPFCSLNPFLICFVSPQGSDSVQGSHHILIGPLHLEEDCLVEQLVD